MPTVYNGCGTWYYGKSNLLRRTGICGACKNQATLESYDTRLFVVILMVPIIPLRKLRIVDQCSRCRRHAIVSWASWQAARGRAQEAIEAYRRAPANAQLAEEAMRLTVTNRDIPAFESVAADVEKNLGSNIKSLSMLAGFYHMFGRLADVERLLGKAIQLEQTPDLYEAMAECLMAQGKAEEAEPYLQHIIDQAIPDRVNCLYQLAQRYQVKGNHERALEIYAHCEAINPLIAQDADFARLRDASNKSLGTNRPVLPTKLLNADKARANRRVAMKVGMAAAVIIAIVYGAICFYQGQNQTVWLVSGVGRPYSAKVNGKTYTLNPGTREKIDLPEGKVSVQSLDPADSSPAQTITISTPFLTRPFSNHTLVINPDQAAVIHRQIIHYVARGTDRPKNQNFYLGGQIFFDVPSIDYPFVEPPQTLQMDSNSTERQSLELVGGSASIAPPMMLQLISDHLDKAALAKVAWQRLQYEPQASGYIDLLAGTMPPAELAAKLRPRLAQRPIVIEWHRAYQNVMMATGQESRAADEYQKALAADPKNPALLYLASRVVHDPDQVTELLRQATQPPEPFVYALYSLCGLELANGQFDKAAEHGLQATEQSPDVNEIRVLAETALQAANRIPDLEKLLEADATAPYPMNLAAISERAYVHRITGRPADTDRDLSELEGKVRGLGADNQAAQRAVEEVRAACDYAAGQTDRFIRLNQSDESAENRLAANLTAGQLDMASFALSKQISVDGLLVTYIAAMHDRKKDVAAKALDLAVQAMEKADFEEQVFGKALEGKSDLPIERLLQYRLPPRTKVLVLTALGLKNPQWRGPCFELARKLNFDRRYPYIILEKALDSSNAG